jgi:hypothetical protein
MGSNGLDVSGNGIRAIGATDWGRLCTLMGLIGIIMMPGNKRLLSSGGGPFTVLPAIEAYQSHERLRGKDDGINMRKKRSPATMRMR